MIKQKKINWLHIIICAVIVLLVALSVIDSSRLTETYSDAEYHIAEHRFQQAVELLESIEKRNYKDTAGLLLLCRAHISYNDGDVFKAYDIIKDVKFSFQTEEQQAEIDRFKETLSQKCDKLMAEKEAQERAEFESRIVNGVPFVGMPESRINDTSLGRPSETVRHNYQVKKGEQYLANLYDFYQDGKRIFCARCVQGVVTEVWDERDNPTTPYVSNSGGKTFDVMPSVDGFIHPEDFYDWYRDDFVDYEDAEEYYYSHGGK